MDIEAGGSSPVRAARAADGGTGAAAIYPLRFSRSEPGPQAYLQDDAVGRLLEFFRAKGLQKLKEEDRGEQWYGDWLAYQKQHGLYAAMLSPTKCGGGGLDLLRYARFLEVFAYCSPAHGYSLQVTFLGLFSILMGTNQGLKQEAVALLRAGALLGFGVSEKDHGSDLLANEFIIADTGTGMVANGRKYYIGNASAAGMLAVLGRKTSTDPRAAARANRAPFVLVALRSREAPAFRSLGKIRTLGVRAADVGGFEVKNHPVPAADVIAEGRDAWDAVFGTVTLGKFFLGFGSIGICEHALAEALDHLRRRILYGKPVLHIPHIQAKVAQAHARLAAMKLYAYRALDYVHAATADDRRYQLFCAVQKARVSTEGVKVMALLSECIGARGFESDTYFEMALRDIQLIPGLEGSMHINLGLAAQFSGRYFDRWDAGLGVPPSLVAGEAVPGENSYLMEARTGATHAIAFRPFLEAYRGLANLPNAVAFAWQAAAFRRVTQCTSVREAGGADTEPGLLLGQCLATIVYGQLVAENAARLKLPLPMISAILGLLVADLSAWALQLASLPCFDGASRARMLQMVRPARTSAQDWQFQAEKLAND
ncbi:MAG TPA: acyl-CoA dehydrogenase family protein [Phycisphaerae bacterium]|nr:acyl-CoA dehydrogenase family protein [Phycisphaerae bacterium]